MRRAGDVPPRLYVGEQQRREETEEDHHSREGVHALHSRGDAGIERGGELCAHLGGHGGAGQLGIWAANCAVAELTSASSYGLEARADSRQQFFSRG